MDLNISKLIHQTDDRILNSSEKTMNKMNSNLQSLSNNVVQNVTKIENILKAEIRARTLGDEKIMSEVTPSIKDIVNSLINLQSQIGDSDPKAMKSNYSKKDKEIGKVFFSKKYY